MVRHREPEVSTSNCATRQRGSTSSGVATWGNGYNVRFSHYVSCAEVFKGVHQRRAGSGQV